MEVSVSLLYWQINLSFGFSVFTSHWMICSGYLLPCWSAVPLDSKSLSLKKSSEQLHQFHCAYNQLRSKKKKKKAANINYYFTFNLKYNWLQNCFSLTQLFGKQLEGSFGRIMFLPQNEEYLSYIGLRLLFGLYNDLKFLLVDRNYM